VTGHRTSAPWAIGERHQEVGHFDVAAMAAETNETIAEISLK
jgi:hypothetical protein